MAALSTPAVEASNHGEWRLWQSEQGLADSYVAGIARSPNDVYWVSHGDPWSLCEVPARDGDRIDWESGDGISGTEYVERSSDGRMHGTSVTGEVVPCAYDGSEWRGSCPPGKYAEYTDSCFASGTMVLTPSGDLPIELVASGDSVFAYDSKAHQLVSRRVLSRKKHKATRIWQIQSDSGAIVSTTPNHHFLSTRGWTSTKNLQPGEELTRAVGPVTRVVSVLRTDRFEPVYNLIVEKENTFVAQGNVVHCFASFKFLQALWHPLSYRISRFFESFQRHQRPSAVRLHKCPSA